ncbi:3',5'-cyclic-nucleotide phosphodiesterase [Halorhodospira halochloris]|uniref:3',5'-cyclic-nucleotide phosphodiesterase n=1 Tax=Halorhodospira halochloris TaxID=1052 RepID=A0A0X8X839_HALHR|nr:phosphodiesterase [Halorhodospira halochloris]BAU57211.1 3',5'-cyclic-nucleotide phosphodiesterase [Halorhodospira halochloris]
MLCPDEPLRVLHISDLHLGDDPQWSYQGVRPWERLTEALIGVDPDCLGAQGLSRAPFDLVVVTGDLAHDQGESVYAKLSEQLAALKVPVLVLPGNHDDPEGFQRIFTDSGQVSYCREYFAGGWRILCLNSQVPGQITGRLGGQQLNALEQDLQQNQDLPTLIALHHAPVEVGTPWLDVQRLEDGESFLELVERYPQVRGVVFGHVHQDFAERRQSGLRLLAAPAVSIQFEPGSAVFAVEPSPPGVRWLELCSNGSLQSEVWWLEGCD